MQQKLALYFRNVTLKFGFLSKPHPFRMDWNFKSFSTHFLQTCTIFDEAMFAFQSQILLFGVFASGGGHGDTIFTIITHCLHIQCCRPWILSICTALESMRIFLHIIRRNELVINSFVLPTADVVNSRKSISPNLLFKITVDVPVAGPERPIRTRRKILHSEVRSSVPPNLYATIKNQLVKLAF